MTDQELAYTVKEMLCPINYKEEFSFGGCAHLALCLHDAYGFDLFAMGRAKDGTLRIVDHYVVGSPDGLYLLDIRGLDEANTFGEKWIDFCDLFPSGWAYRKSSRKEVVQALDQGYIGYGEAVDSSQGKVLLETAQKAAKSFLAKDIQTLSDICSKEQLV